MGFSAYLEAEGGDLEGDIIDANQRAGEWEDLAVAWREDALAVRHEIASVRFQLDGGARIEKEIDGRGHELRGAGDGPDWGEM